MVVVVVIAAQPFFLSFLHSFLLFLSLSKKGESESERKGEVEEDFFLSLSHYLTIT